MNNSLDGSWFNRYFPYGKGAFDENIEYFKECYSKMNTNNVIKYFRGFSRRKELTEGLLSKIKCYTLVISGENSPTHNESILYQKRMPRRYTTWVKLDDAGFLLTESCPQKIIGSISLFLQTSGLTITTLQAKYGKIKPSSN